MVFYRAVADVIVILHLAYATFILFGLILILAGILFRWSWVRNFWFRAAHLTAIGVVALEAAFGIPCPLTTWENYFRRLAGEATYPGSFFGNAAQNTLFFEAPDWVFEIAYIVFFVAVLLTFVAARPRWPSRRAIPMQASGTDRTPQ